MNDSLEKLCRPLLLKLCEYSRIAKGNASVLELNEVATTVRQEMDSIQSACGNDPALYREFQKVERPLVFFIDYVIKEGHFPFAGQWTELARQYNELSGDEKFFDLLTETLDDPDSTGRIAFFQLLMGLGFDGIYQSDKEFVDRRMRVCAARRPMGFAPDKEPLTPLEKMQAGAEIRRSFWRSYRFVLLLLLLFALGAWIFNFYVFSEMTSNYRASLRKAIHATSPLPAEARLPHAGSVVAPAESSGKQNQDTRP